MLQRVILAACVGVFTALIILLIGVILVAIKVPIATSIGDFISQWCWVFGLIAGIWFFFTGRTSLSL